MLQNMTLNYKDYMKQLMKLNMNQLDKYYTVDY